MPVPVLVAIAKRAGISIEKAEKIWKESKAQAKEQGFKEGSDRFYKYVMGVTKKRMGLNEDIESQLSDQYLAGVI